MNKDSQYNLLLNRDNQSETMSRQISQAISFNEEPSPSDYAREAREREADRLRKRKTYQDIEGEEMQDYGVIDEE